MFQRLMRSNAEKNQSQGDSQKKIKEMVRNLVPSVESQVSGTAVTSNSSNSPGRRNRARRMDRRSSLAHASKLLRIMRDRALHDSHRDIISKTVNRLKKQKNNNEEEISHNHGQLLKAAHLHIRRTRTGNSSRDSSLVLSSVISSWKSTSNKTAELKAKKTNIVKTTPKIVEEKKKETVTKSIDDDVGYQEEEEESLESKLSKLLSM